MAYKFQIGAARLSGSLTQEGAVTAESAALSGSTLTTKTGGLSIGGVAVTATPAELNILDGVAAATYAAADSVVFFDADDSKFKHETAQDFAVFMGGNGLTASAGKLLIQPDTTQNGAAHLNVDANGISIKSQIANDGLNMESGLLKVQVTGAASLVGSAGSRKVGVATSIAGTGLDASGSSNALHTLTVSAAQTGITSIINSSFSKLGTASDQEYIDFSTSNEIHFVVNDNVQARITSTGLVVEGTTTSINSTTLLVEDSVIELNVVTGSEGRASNSGAGFFISGSTTDKEASLLLTADGGKFKASGSAGGGFDVAAGGGYAIDGTVLLSATALHANVLVDGDSLRINNCDASLTSGQLATDDLLVVHDDGVGPKKITAGNLRTFMQTGVTATSTNGFAFNEYNTGSAAQSLGGNTGYWGAASTDGTSSNAVTLMLSGSWSNGNVVIIKAPSNAGAAAGNRKLTILPNAASNHTIDGENSILLESDNAAVTLVYGGGNWNIV